MQPQQINYSALINKKSAPKLGLALLPLGFIFVVIGVIVTASGPAPKPGQTGTTSPLGSIGLGLGFLTGLIGIVVTIFQLAKSYAVDPTKFAADNGWHMPGTATESQVPYALTSGGYNGRLLPTFGGSYRGLPMEAFSYQFEIHSGSNSDTPNTLHYLVVSVQLPVQLPLIILDDTQNDLFKLSDLPGQANGTTPLQLEGNFNTRYKLRVQTGVERQVLEFLTPDVMERLMQTPAVANVEIYGGRLTVFAQAAQFEAKNAQNLFGMADAVLNEVTRRLPAQPATPVAVSPAAAPVAPKP